MGLQVFMKGIKGAGKCSSLGERVLDTQEALVRPPAPNENKHQKQMKKQKETKRILNPSSRNSPDTKKAPA